MKKLATTKSLRSMAVIEKTRGTAIAVGSARRGVFRICAKYIRLDLAGHDQNKVAQRFENSLDLHS